MKKIVLISLLFSGCFSAPKNNTQLLPYIIKSEYQPIRPENQRSNQINVESEALARKKLSNLTASLQTLTEATIDPYSNKEDLPLECQKKSLPLPITFENENEITIATSLYSSANFVLGCASQERIKAQVQFLYCKKSNLIISLISLWKDDRPDWPNQGVASCP